MRELSEFLAQATADIGPHYFLMPIDGGESVYRERVYAYELYHQLRSRWPEKGPYSLNGEVDKAAHPILRNLGAAGRKPDLLVHGPGDMGLNHAILEIKSANPDAEAITKDLETLVLFRTAVRYDRAIYLLYGAENDRLLVRIRNRYIELQTEALVEVWFHGAVGQRAHHVATLGA